MLLKSVSQVSVEVLTVEMLLPYQGFGGPGFEF